MVPMTAPETAHGPFDKQQGDPHQKESDQIGNDKGTAAVLDRLYRKTQEVS